MIHPHEKNNFPWLINRVHIKFKRFTTKGVLIYIILMKLYSCKQKKLLTRNNCSRHEISAYAYVNRMLEQMCSTSYANTKKTIEIFIKAVLHSTIISNSRDVPQKKRQTGRFNLHYFNEASIVVNKLPF